MPAKPRASSPRSPVSREAALAFIVESTAETDVGSLTQHFLDLARPFGFAGATYVRIAEAGRRIAPDPLFGEGDEAWGRAYAETGAFRHDPAFPLLFQTAKTFTWSDIALGNLKRDQLRVIGLAADHRLMDGLVVPVPAQRGGVAAVIMPSNERLDLSPEDRALIAAWATTFARRGLELCANDNPSTAHLTGRERQCLAWAAEGKSDWHIGEILSLAAPTIHMHIENARKKLGCRTRHQAALEAWRLGLLAN